MSVLEMEPGLATTMSGGPLEGLNPELGMEPAMVIDLMGEGSVIEKNPTPVASIIATQPAAEAILQRMFGPQTGTEGEDGQPGERFTPYTLTGDPAEIFGGITVIGQDPESLASANTFVRQLLGSIQRPEDEASETAPDTLGNKEYQTDPGSGLGKNLLTAFRRSRLAKAVTAGAFVVSGALYLAPSAEADTQQDCIDAGLNPSTVKAAKMYGARKDHGAGWTVHIRLNTDAMPAECTDYNRLVNLRVLMQDGKHRSRWINLQPWSGDNNGLGDVFNGSSIGGGPSFDNITHDHDPSFTKDNYVCTPGPGKTKVKFQMMNTVEDSSGNVVGGPKTNTNSLKVYGAC
jgi:hypothetical protein